VYISLYEEYKDASSGNNTGRISTDKKIEAAIKNQQATAALINSAIGEVRSIISRHADPTSTPDMVSYDYCQARVQKYKTLRQDFYADDVLSPESKNGVQVVIAQSMRKRWLKRALFTAEHGSSKKLDIEKAERGDDESE
jgi:hypothetical protein